jgi:hypothetical protein
MSRTIIGFIVDNEIAFTLPLYDDEPGVEQIKSWYLSNPTIIETTLLPYSPINGSVWDGENFIIPGHSYGVHEKSVQDRPGYEGFRSFAFAIDNVCFDRLDITPMAEGPIAALLSNPTLLDITEMVAALEEGQMYLGKFVRNGQIVSE